MFLTFKFFCFLSDFCTSLHQLRKIMLSSLPSVLNVLLVFLFKTTGREICFTQRKKKHFTSLIRWMDIDARTNIQ